MGKQPALSNQSFLITSTHPPAQGFSSILVPPTWASLRKAGHSSLINHIIAPTPAQSSVLTGTFSPPSAFRVGGRPHLERAGPGPISAVQQYEAGLQIHGGPSAARNGRGAAGGDCRPALPGGPRAGRTGTRTSPRPGSRR